MSLFSGPIRPPGFAAAPLNAAMRRFLTPEGEAPVDFSQPAGAPALVGPDSVSWRVFKNPVALFAGGVAAVILELAEPRVRTGVWEHTSFRADPAHRLSRTGLAAMMTVYGPKDAAEAMIAGVRRAHERVSGTTPAGTPYRANDPELLNWVQATAMFGFVQAYHRFVHPLSDADRERACEEAQPAARLYGASGAPSSVAEMEALFSAMTPALEPHPIVFEFLELMDAAPILPAPLRLAQRLMLRAGVDLVPGWARETLGLGPETGLGRAGRAMARRAGAMADRIVLPANPAVQACRRLGLPDDYLYRRSASEGPL